MVPRAEFRSRQFACCHLLTTAATDSRSFVFVQIWRLTAGFAGGLLFLIKFHIHPLSPFPTTCAVNIVLEGNMPPTMMVTKRKTMLCKKKLKHKSTLNETDTEKLISKSQHNTTNDGKQSRRKENLLGKQSSWWNAAAQQRWRPWRRNQQLSLLDGKHSSPCLLDVQGETISSSICQSF